MVRSGLSLRDGGVEAGLKDLNACKQNALLESSHILARACELLQNGRQRRVATFYAYPKGLNWFGFPGIYVP